MIKLFTKYFFFFSASVGFCQSPAVYPDVLSTYFYNMPAINPGYVPKEGKVDIAVGYQFHQGQLSKVTSLSFSATRIFKVKNRAANAIRATAYNEKHGPYISSPKGYLNYAIRLKIANETSLYSGVTFGASGVFFSAPTFSYSLFLPDGGIGLGISYKKLELGFASLQVFNSSDVGAGDSYRLGRFYNLHISSELALSAAWDLKVYGLWRILPKAGNDFQGTAAFLYNQVWTLGTSLRIFSGTSFFTAFQLDTAENDLLLAFTYNAAPLLSSLQAYHNSLEISLGLRLR